MIRPFTCICMFMAAGTGLYLYQTKHRAQLLDREIMHTLKQTDQVRDRIGVLRGEWALLNEPERLADLAKQHLALRTLAPTQFVALADLATRLPAPLPPGTNFPPPAEDAPAPSLAAPAAGVPVATARPSPAMAATAASRTAANSAATPSAPSTVSTAPPQPVQVAALPQPAPASRPVRPITPPVPVPGSAAAAPASAPAAPPATQPAVAAPPAPAPRIMAPVVNVSATQIQAALRPAPGAQPGNAIGESVARTARLAAGGLASQAAPPANLLPTTTATPAYVAPAYAGAPSSGSAPSFGSTPSFGSALGANGRAPLPAPVPYGTASAR